MSLELKKKKLQLMQVSCAKESLKIKIEEMQEEIKRLESHVAIQEATELKLQEEIAKEIPNG